MTFITFRYRKTEMPRGFTLLELVGVLMIIALLMTIMTPSLRGFAASRQTVESAAQIVALMAHARDIAVNEGGAYRFNFHPQLSSYWLTRQESANYIEVKGLFGQIFSLPRDVTARWRDENGNVVAREHVTFYPTGRIEPAILHLTGRDGKVALVRCDAPTEMYRVQTINLK